MSRSSAGGNRRPPRIKIYRPRWRNGRLGGLKNLCPCGRAGSNPALGTEALLERHLAAALAARGPALSHHLVACPEGLREPTAERAWGLARTAAAQPDHLLGASLRVLREPRGQEGQDQDDDAEGNDAC